MRIMCARAQTLPIEQWKGKKNCVDCSMRKKAEKNVLQLQRARKKSERMHVGRKKVKEMRGRFVRLIAAFF